MLSSRIRRRIAMIGAPLCDGEREQGVEKAPIALRVAGLLEVLRSVAEVRDFGDLSLVTPIPDRKMGKLRNLENNVAGCQKVMKIVIDALRDGYFPLLIGGDCSLFPGAMAGVKDVHKDARAIYFDGHADFNTPEATTSGYLSGMALATAVGKGQGQLGRIGTPFPIIRQDEIVVIGVRKTNFDSPELENLERSNVHVVWLDALTEQKASDVVAEEIETSKPVFLHFDIDVIDQRDMPALAGIKSGVHSPGGLSYAEALTICRTFSKLPLIGMELTLYDPSLDAGGTHAKGIIQLLRALLGTSDRQ